jgi:hypothetical protein
MNKCWNYIAVIVVGILPFGSITYAQERVSQPNSDTVQRVSGISQEGCRGDIKDNHRYD